MTSPGGFALLSLSILLIATTLHSVRAEPSQNVSRGLDHNAVLGNYVQRRKTYASKKGYVTKKRARPQNYAYKESPSSNLCPCHLKSAEGSRCYDFMNQAAGTCRARPCADGFVCTSRSYATHYCFEKTKYVTKVVSVGVGRCTTKKERLTFRVPYVDIVPRGDEREKELNYNTLIRDDVYAMEPGACFA